MNEIYVAKLGKTVGLDGAMKIHLDTDFPQQFKKGVSFLTHKKESLCVESFNKARSLIKFEGINSIDEAKKFVNAQLFTTIEQTRQNCNLDKNQFFWFDLINTAIIDKQNDTLLELGTIKEVLRLPSADYFEIQTSNELIAKEYPKVFLIPYTADYVLEVNIAEKKVYTQNALGILENS
jgi:16S rRNA processing protein RimM